MVDKFKVFISWSGDLAKAVAKVWQDLIKEVFDGVEPFMSEENIGAGERGLAKIATELAGTGFGIIVVTQENQHSQWLNYEAGALSKDVNDQTVRVAPSLVDFERKNDVTGPLGQFQGTLLTKEGVGKILAELAKVVAVDESSVSKRFHRAWQDEYSDKFNRAKAIGSRPAKTAHRHTPEMLDEILTLVREMARTSKPLPVNLPTMRPQTSEVQRVLEMHFGPEFEPWNLTFRGTVPGRRQLILQLPFDLSPDDEASLASELAELPGVDAVTITSDPRRFEALSLNRD